MTQGPTRIPSKGACIYCGDTKSELTDEHVLPYSIGGVHILNDASCKLCAKITTRFERDVLKGLWDDARNSYNAPSRRKYKREKFIFLSDPKGQARKLKIPYEEYPAPMVFYHMDTAGLLLDLPESVDRSKFWTFKAITDQQKLEAFEKKYPGRLTAQMRFNHDSYARMLEKIGYCQVLCSLDPADFRPICLPYILGQKSNHSYIVGSSKSIPEPQKNLGYSLSTICFGSSHYMLLMAEIRILANNHTPVYHVVVGDVDGVEKVEAVRKKVVATYEVVVTDDFGGYQSSTNELHWAPRVWPLKYLSK